MIVPSSPNGILTFPFYPDIGRREPQEIIGRLIVQLMKPERHLHENERQIVFNILKALSQVETFTRAAEVLLQVKFILTAVLGEWPKATRPYEFPEVFQQAAAAILAKVEADLDIEEVVDETPPTPTSPVSATTGKKRKKKAANPNRSAVRELPDIHSSSYKGIMRGIVISNEGNASYKLADRSMRVPANVFGHNGLQVGDWWPKWICALRDGAHGRTQGGIYSRLGVGAFSIVVSGKSHCFLTCPLAIHINRACRSLRRPRQGLRQRPLLFRQQEPRQHRPQPSLHDPSHHSSTAIRTRPTSHPCPPNFGRNGQPLSGQGSTLRWSVPYRWPRTGEEQEGRRICAIQAREGQQPAGHGLEQAYSGREGRV